MEITILYNEESNNWEVYKNNERMSFLSESLVLDNRALSLRDILEKLKEGKKIPYPK